MPPRHALIAGVTGLVGRRIAAHLHSRGWSVTGLCRRPREAPWPLVAVDLTDAADCRAKLAALGDVTHVFYAARYDHPEGVAESVDVNAAMLVNLLDALEPVASGLTHVHCVHGTKYYGHMAGPLVLPLTEESPRARNPNFYFAQEDFLRARSRGKTWTFSLARPHTFCDESTDEARNAALLIAVQATIARATNAPLAFPGSKKSFHARTQFTYVPMLARAAEWMATEPRCANEAYNVVNGDNPSWSELWPRFAAYFGVPAGGPACFRLADEMAEKEAVWRALVLEHALESVALADRVLWPYADYLFAPEWDIISSMAKARRDGFHETVTSGDMFVELFGRFRSQKIIP